MCYYRQQLLTQGLSTGVWITAQNTGFQPVNINNLC